MRNGKYMKIRKTEQENKFQKILSKIGHKVIGPAIFFTTIVYLSAGNMICDRLKSSGINSKALEYVQGMDTLTLRLMSEINGEYPVIGVDNLLFMQNRENTPSGLGPGELRSAYRQQFRIDNNRFGSDALNLERNLEPYIIRFDGEANHQKIRENADSLGYLISR